MLEAVLLVAITRKRQTVSDAVEHQRFNGTSDSQFPRVLLFNRQPEFSYGAAPDLADEALGHNLR